ncbi:lysine N(6)-hydroxylase/L-ornithine N(5)-oxygenase family protein [Paraburkholderia sp. EG304]|uniref:lysine N(6)-hydroxylase/L-ornithine N(5)-oxygenase family protein n=1 Tax=Paraburkholderia sp. EG304 TaxID=3237015 RepID=UPI00397DF281
MSRESVVAVGAGPANLSLAALAYNQRELAVTVFERALDPAWHPGLMVDGALMQTSFLKDLVSLVDPTNPYSFLAYLKDHRRLYRAVVCGLDRITRQEFQDYLKWAAMRLPNIRFGTAINEIDLDRDSFCVRAKEETVRTKTVVIGVGREPFVPDFARLIRGKNVFHSGAFLSEKRNFSGSSVAVVGGGQSSAEVVSALLRGLHGEPASITWVSRRPNLFALEDSPFVNEWFFPQHSMWFQRCSREARERILMGQELAGDGVSASTLREIYQLLYEREVAHKARPGACEIRIDSSVEAMSLDGPGYLLTVRDRVNGDVMHAYADVVILCTGYRSSLPRLLEPLRSRLSFVQNTLGDTELEIRDDFSVVLDGPPGCRLYLQNGARSQYGVADAYLSLLSWRSARILNAILRMERFDCGVMSGAITWSGETLAASRKPSQEMTEKIS